MNKQSTIIISLLVILIALVGYVAFKPKEVMNNSSVVIPSNDVVLDNNSISAEPIKTTPTKPMSVPTGWKAFTSSNNDFSIQYPTTYLAEESNNGGYYNEVNLHNLSIRFPIGYQKGTDFNVGFISVSVSPTTNKCYASGGQDQDMTATKTIGSTVFHYNPSQPTDDSAMGGQRGKAWLYSTIQNGKCYRIEKTIGYRDVHGYVDEPYNYPAHYDEAKASADLDAVIATLVLK